MLVGFISDCNKPNLAAGVYNLSIPSIDKSYFKIREI